MQLSAEITSHDNTISTHCLVVFTHPEAKTKEELLDCFTFNVSQQDFASGLMGSIPLWEEPKTLVRDGNEDNPKKILDYIKQFFGDRKNRQELRQKWVYVILFEQITARILMKYNKNNNSELPSSIQIEHLEALRSSYGLFRTHAQGVGKYFTTHDELEKAIVDEILTNTHKDIWPVLIEHMIKLV